MNATDYLVHFSNVLMLVAYSVRDIPWLRWFAVAAALMNIPYFLLQPTRCGHPSSGRSSSRRPTSSRSCASTWSDVEWMLSDDEQALYEMACRSLRPREFGSLALIGEWRTAAAGDGVRTEDQRVACVCIAVRGTLRVHRAGREMAVIEPGHLIGAGFDGGSVTRGGDVRDVRALHLVASAEHPQLPRAEARASRHAAGLVNRDLAWELGELVSARLESAPS